MTDRFEEMRVFAAVVEAGGFTAAAARLGMSKAAVSRHVAELEERLGVRLLHRTTRTCASARPWAPCARKACWCWPRVR